MFAKAKKFLVVAGFLSVFALGGWVGYKLLGPEPPAVTTTVDQTTTTNQNTTSSTTTQNQNNTTSNDNTHVVTTTDTTVVQRPDGTTTTTTHSVTDNQSSSSTSTTNNAQTSSTTNTQTSTTSDTHIEQQTTPVKKENPISIGLTVKQDLQSALNRQLALTPGLMARLRITDSFWGSLDLSIKGDVQLAMGYDSIMLYVHQSMVDLFKGKVAPVPGAGFDFQVLGPLHAAIGMDLQRNGYIGLSVTF